MRIVFIGTAPFAVPSLQALVKAGHDIPLVVTQPDRPGHRLRLTPPAVKTAAADLGLTVYQPEKVRAPEAVARLAGLVPDLIVVVAYGQIIPRSVLEVPAQGVLNVHASLLPRHRGAAPVSRAILDGDRATGVTIMRMDELLDHGPILASTQTEISPCEGARELTERLASLGAELLVETISHLSQIKAVEQDHEAATTAPRLSREDGELSWELTADDIDRHVRGLQPWPGVTLPLPAGGRLKVLKGRPLTGTGRPGEILAVRGDGVEVAAGSGSYLLQEVQLPGGRPVAARVLKELHA